jgi:hypothetical protein
MSSRHPGSHDDGERGRAVERLRAAIADRSHAHDARKAAEGSKDDVDASAFLRVADEQVAARERWLKSLEAHDY